MSILPNKLISSNSSFLFYFQGEWVGLVTNLILDELIIPNSQLDVKNFFRARLFFQGEWIRLVTNLILYGLIILELEPNVKNFFRVRLFFSR